jgi:hypothetical protein
VYSLCGAGVTPWACRNINIFVCSSLSASSSICLSSHPGFPCASFLSSSPLMFLLVPSSHQLYLIAGSQYHRLHTIIHTNQVRTRLFACVSYSSDYHIWLVLSQTGVQAFTRSANVWTQRVIAGLPEDYVITVWLTWALPLLYALLNLNFQPTDQLWTTQPQT